MGRVLQDGDRRMKMQNMVKFPLTGMDMAPHMVKRSQSSWSLPSHWSPWRRPYGLGRDPEDYLYDLYAVCNHHGTMQGGHYTGNNKLNWLQMKMFRENMNHILLHCVFQLTVRTPLMGSGIALMIVMFIPCLKMKCASRPLTSCFIKDVPQFLRGLPTALWEVIFFFFFIDVWLYSLFHTVRIWVLSMKYKADDHLLSVWVC